MFKQLHAFGDLLFRNQQLGLQFNTGLHTSKRLVTHDNQVGFTITGEDYRFIKLMAKFRKAIIIMSDCCGGLDLHLRGPFLMTLF